jgi:hypothetical protein
MKDELNRRANRTDLIEALFRSQPNTWILIYELAKVGGLGGWRTRCSQCRTERAMNIEWNGRNGNGSAYRFIPYQPLGRSAETQIDQKTLFELR